MNNSKPFIYWLIGVLIGGLLAGCVVATPPPTGDVSLIHTRAVETVSAQLTLDAGSTAVALLTQMALATITPTPNPALTATPTPLPNTPTPLPPTATPPPPTLTPSPLVPCDWLQFISDVTIPDGKEFLPGVKFTKTWRLKNIGNCTWTRDYALVFSGGDQMSGSAVVSLTGEVPPGATVDLSVNLTAPASEGSYTGYWKLRNASGVLFGWGDDRNQSVSVRIRVDLSDSIYYDYADRYCKADWTNSRLPLICPTTIQDEKIGYVFRDDTPRLETGDQDNEAALITHPDMGGFMRFDFLGEQGLISGVFPSLAIEDGDRFEAVIGCMYGHVDCNVLFYLMVLKPNGNYDVLASWQEYYDTNVTTVNVDLSEWAGREIRLILAVASNGSSEDDEAFWLHPRLMR